MGFLVQHFFEGESVTCGWLSDFGGFAQSVLVLGLEMFSATVLMDLGSLNAVRYSPESDLTIHTSKGSLT